MDARNDMDTDQRAESDHAEQTKSPTQEEWSIGTHLSETKKVNLSTRQDFRKRTREVARSDLGDIQHKKKRRLQDIVNTQIVEGQATEQSNARDDIAHEDLAACETQQKTSIQPKEATLAPRNSKKRKRKIGERDQRGKTEERDTRKRRLQEEVVGQQEGGANAGHSQLSSLAYACELLTDCTLPVIS